jgi:hypothetical protein
MSTILKVRIIQYWKKHTVIANIEQQETTIFLSVLMGCMFIRTSVSILLSRWYLEENKFKHITVNDKGQLILAEFGMYLLSRIAIVLKF